ncbi:uncharacterized protein LOC131692411 [Topomyia yanbarensis]|uniref:uncharacterized protein LOC131692411 n=1 Tax=Topomyia yanbarensis TaxID=2498891 RepID=UPI00273B02CC|nr:uncharacterized protein LOC131692411 [Topomyia yanbarensis]
MISAIVSRIVILLFGTLYPAYASYKAVRTKNVKEYVKWMMYWIVFAFFTCVETFTDILLSWFPFYYEIKVIIVLWLLSPATRGSSTLYRKFVHPMLTRREQEIDDYINQAKEKGYTAVLQLGSKGVNYATNVIMQTAIKGGGGLVQTLRKSYSLSDLSETDAPRTQEEMDELTRPQRVLRSKSARSASGGRHVEMYFPEVELAGTPHHNPPPYNYIRSSDDISSGYSSAEPGLSRTASMSNTARPRVKSKTREDDEEVFRDGRDTDRYYGSGSQFPPFATLYEIPSTPLPAITQANESIPDTMCPPIYTSKATSVSISPQAIPPDVDQKYHLFLQWMESQKQTDAERVETFPYIDNPEPIDSDGLVASEEIKVESVSYVPHFLDNNPVSEKEDFRIEAPMMTPVSDLDTEHSEKDLLDDAFRDTISLSSEDEFLEVDDSFSEVITDASNELPLIVEPLHNESQLGLEPSIPQDEAIPTVIDTMDMTEQVPNITETKPNTNYSEDDKSSSTLFLQENLHISEDDIFSKDPKDTVKNTSEIPLSESLEMTVPTSSSLNVSTSNLTTSTSSLALSETSSHADDPVSSKKLMTHGKKKAPPIPIVFKAETLIPSVDAPSIPKLPEKVQKSIPVSVQHSKSIGSESSIEKEKDKKHKPNKLMSSLSGMFKHDSAPTSATVSTSKLPARAGDSLLPKETEI